MAFEFFFRVFGLISSDSKSRHKTRVDGDWRMFTPLGASLFGAGQKAPMPAASSKGSADEPTKPVFSTTGTLVTANNSGKYLTEWLEGAWQPTPSIRAPGLAKLSLTGDQLAPDTMTSSLSFNNRQIG